jgi:PhnB protein
MNPTPRIPENYPRVCPRLFVADADAAIAFYVDVLGATERGSRLRTPDGKVLHSALVIGDSLIMVSVGVPELGAVAPDPAGTTTVMLHLYVEDVDGVTARAEAAGARILRAPRDEFYGDRTATIADPFGHRWGIASHVEDVGAEEMSRRVTELMRPDRP